MFQNFLKLPPHPFENCFCFCFYDISQKQKTNFSEKPEIVFLFLEHFRETETGGVAVWANFGELCGNFLFLFLFLFLFPTLLRSTDKYMSTYAYLISQFESNCKNCYQFIIDRCCCDTSSLIQLSLLELNGHIFLY